MKDKNAKNTKNINDEQFQKKKNEKGSKEIEFYNHH